MANAGKYDKYFYFRGRGDEDDDDDSESSVMVPVCKITGMEPFNAITNIRVWFESEQNTTAIGLGLQNGHIDLTVTRGKLKEVMQTLVSAMNAGPHSDGVTVIADIVTTDYDGTTRKKKFLHPDITSVSTISIN
tara:strand:+ start:1902 stop:2303 length:402 start_codon:yes stop_codon:yes gene_type:complete